MNTEENNPKNKSSIIKNNKYNINMNTPLSSSPEKLSLKKINNTPKINSKAQKFNISSSINLNFLAESKKEKPKTKIEKMKKHNLLNTNIKYGIDESGNPMNIKEYYKSINDSVYSNTNTSIFSGLTSAGQKLRRPIAYITKDENGNNILVNLKGNKITKKNKDGDYEFPLELRVIIKDFDVKHPELRVNGERYYNENIGIDEENEEKNDINIDEKKCLNFKDTSKLIYKSAKNMNNSYNRYILNKNNNDLIINNNNNGKKTGMNELIIKTNENKKNINNKNHKNIFYAKYGQINIFENDNKTNNRLILRTHDILNNDNSQIQQNDINITQINNSNNCNTFKKLKSIYRNKNKSYIIPVAQTKMYKLSQSKSNKDMLFNINNKIKNKTKLNLIEKIITECNTTSNMPNLKMDINLSHIKNRNRNKNRIDNYFNDSNIKNKTYKYFIINHNKSFTNSKSYKKILDKKNLIKKINKTKLIPKCNKIKNKNIFKMLDNKNTNSYASNKFQNGKNFILSKEANNMIKSYSKDKLIKEKKKFKNILSKINNNEYRNKINIINSAVNYSNDAYNRIKQKYLGLNLSSSKQ